MKLRCILPTTYSNPALPMIRDTRDLRETSDRRRPCSKVLLYYMQSIKGSRLLRTSCHCMRYTERS